MSFKIYDGVVGLGERTPIAFAVSAGVKVQALLFHQRPLKNCYPCKGKPGNARCRECRGEGKVKMRGGVWRNDRLFIKKFRSERPVGAPITDAIRVLADEFRIFNGSFACAACKGEGCKTCFGTGEAETPPEGSGVLLAHLPGGDPKRFWNHHRRAQQLGQMKGVKFVRAPDTEAAPNHAAECSGDGTLATRWQRGADGKFGWAEIPCTGMDCPFAPVCKVRTSVNLLPEFGQGRPAGLMQYVSQGVETATGFKGFFKRITDEARELGVESLYGLPVRLTIATKTKGAGEVRFGKQVVQMKPRRFPVVDITEAMPLAEFSHHQRQLLGKAPQHLALPEPVAGPIDLIEGDMDLAVEAEIARRPREEAAAEKPSDVIDAALEEQPGAPKSAAEKQEGPPAYVGDEKAKEIEAFINDRLHGFSWKGFDPKKFGDVTSLAELPEDLLPHLKRLLKKEIARRKS